MLDRIRQFLNLPFVQRALEKQPVMYVMVGVPALGLVWLYHQIPVLFGLIAWIAAFFGVLMAFGEVMGVDRRRRK